MKELRKNVKERDGENYALNGELEELNVSVNERRHIHEVNGKRNGGVGYGCFGFEIWLNLKRVLCGLVWNRERTMR